MLSRAKGDGEGVGPGLGGKISGCVVAGCNGDGAGGFEERDDEDGIFDRFVTIGWASEVIRIWRRGRPWFLAVVGTIAFSCLGRWAIPVDELIFTWSRDRFRAGLEGGDVGYGHGEPAIMGHVICPFGVAVIAMGRAEGPNVMRLAVVVPGEDFDVLRGQGQYFVPTFIPEKVTREDPVLAVGDFKAIVS